MNSNLDYAVTEVRLVADHFSRTLKKTCPEFDIEEVFGKLQLLKKVLHKRYGTTLQSLSWSDVYDAEFPQFMLIIELLNCLPPASVQCETTFSQMKLIKTSRRTKLSTSTLNSIIACQAAEPIS